MESKEGQSHVLSQSSCDDMRQIRGEHSKKGTRPDIMTSPSISTYGSSVKYVRLIFIGDSKNIDNVWTKTKA